MTHALVRTKGPSMITLLMFLQLFIEGIHGLKMCDLDVPGAVIAGKSVWLRCGYDLEEDELYSVKWYKNNVEFYRYLPSDVPPGQKYDLLGVYVDDHNPRDFWFRGYLKNMFYRGHVTNLTALKEYRTACEKHHIGSITVTIKHIHCSSPSGFTPPEWRPH
ncbi:uncharacterized protein LOC111637270 [Centruroides sculpturatus]|uniref:uncharacterized protein LOC111637270 n=1 Tax=Centruroides sculpturatus TaxID=218467 RepID=UPI000C6DD18C|nr:uncharacterized protein LOC111637270 [Centruroides sculpturatus]